MAVNGLNWPAADSEQRAEPGDEVPAEVVRAAPWLLEQGHVVERAVTPPPPVPDAKDPANV